MEENIAPVATPTSVPQIYPALVAVAAELAKVGIAKDRKNEQQGFRFRGIDDVMNVVSPILAKHHVVFLPNYQHGRPDVERQTAKGGTLIYADVIGTFSFVSALDGSCVTVTAPGNAMDSGDKGTNKAMSAALKYAILHTFLIPTESNEDADATTPEPSVAKPPVGFDEWFVDMIAVADNGFNAVRDAWRVSKEEFRDYALKYRKSEWDAAKKKANDISKKELKDAKAKAEAPAVP